MDTPLDRLAAAVCAARKAAGLSQRDLASKLNMNTRTIIDLEKGRSNPKAETVFILAAELHISLDAILFAGTDAPNAVSADVLDFFSDKSPEESLEYVQICRQIENMKNGHAPG